MLRLPETTTILKIESVYLLSLEIGGDDWNDVFKFNEFHLTSRTEYMGECGLLPTLNLELKIRSPKPALEIPFRQWMIRFQDTISLFKTPFSNFKVNNTFQILGTEYRCSGIFIRSIDYERGKRDYDLVVNLRLDYVDIQE